MKSWIIVAFLSAATLTNSAAAQVGHPPDKSPYRDRDYNRDWTFFAGPFNGQHEPIGVAPTEGPMAGRLSKSTRHR